MLSEVVKDVVFLAFPPIDTNDYWVDATTGIIYKFQSDLATIAELRMVPILQRARVTVEDRGNIIYEYPFPNG